MCICIYVLAVFHFLGYDTGNFGITSLGKCGENVTGVRAVAGGAGKTPLVLGGSGEVTLAVFPAKAI